MTVTRDMVVADLSVAIERKAIRHCYIRVTSPGGAVRVSAGPAYSDTAIRALVESRLPWIRAQRERLQRREKAMPAEPVLSDGARVVFRGAVHSLRIVPGRGNGGVRCVDGELQMRTAPESDEATRRQLLERFYRREAKARLPALIARWEPIMGVQVKESRVRRMKTLWGSCNPPARRIWLNLDLIRYPDTCFEYVLVHEMVHLLERGHNARFYGFMDRFLPDWRARRARLNGGCLD